MTIPDTSAESVRDVLKLIYRKDIEVDDAREGEVDTVIKKFKLNASKSYESREESSIDQTQASDTSIQEVSLELPLPPLDLSLQPSDHSESESDLSDLESHMANVHSNINSTLIMRPIAKKTIVRGKKRRVNHIIRRVICRIIRRRDSCLRKRRSRNYYSARFACRYCPMRVIFQFKRGRSNHELTCPFNPKSRDYFGCDKCGKRYLFKGRLELHVKTKHLQDPEV